MLQRRCRPERVVSHLVIVHKLWGKILQRHTTIKWHYESQPIQCNAKMTQISQRDPKWYGTNSQQFRHSHFRGKSQGHDVCFRFQKAKSWLVNQWTRNCLKWCGRTGKVGGIATGQMHIATQDPPGTGLYQFRCCRQLQPNCPYWFDLIPQVNPSLIANFCYKYVSTNLRFSQHWKSPESDLRLRSAPRPRIQVLQDLQIALLLVGLCQQQHLCFQQMYTNVAFGRNSTARRLSDLPISNPQYEPTSNLSHGSLNVPIEHHPTIRYMVYNGYYKVMSNIPKMGQFPTPVS